MPLGVVYTKSYNIWDDINPFIDKLVAGYKQSQQTKWNNEWQLSAIADIEKANKPGQVNSFLEMQKIPEENLDVPGFTKFATDAMGMLAQKEMMFEDGMPSKGNYPQPDTIEPQNPVKTTKPMPDVKEFNELYKYVSELPTGKVDWTNTMSLFKEKLESGRAMGTAAQQFLSMIMGESMPVNQRQKVQQDFEFTKDIKSTLYPEMVEDKPSSDYERWKRDPEGFAAFKQAGRQPEMVFDWESFLKDNPDWMIKSINVKGEPILGRKDTTKEWEFDTWEEAQQWTKAHPQEGFVWKIDTYKEGFNVIPIKKTTTPQGGTDKLVPTYGTINSINERLRNPDLDYDTELHNAQIKYNLEGVKLATKADQARSAYDVFERIIIGEEYINEEGVVQDEEAYMDYYKDYERYAKKYFEETGEILPKKYLSIEEAGVYEKIQWARGKAKGGQKPIINTENIPWSWQTGIDPTEAIYNQMQRTGTTLEDVNLEDLAKVGVDVDKLKGLLGL